MSSLILRTITGLFFSLMMLLSFFIFLRGHNEPGGGFIGGLIAAAAFILFVIAFSPDIARRILFVDPNILIGVGLLSAVSSGLIPVFIGQPFLTGLWMNPVLFGNELHIGTPLLFDIGVYLAVIGFTLTSIYSLEEEEEEKN